MFCCFFASNRDTILFLPFFLQKEDDNDEVFVDDQSPPSLKQRSNSVIDSIGGSGIVFVVRDGADESPSASPAGDGTSRKKSLSAPEVSTFIYN